MDRRIIFTLPMALLALGCHRSDQASIGQQVSARDAGIARHEDPNALKPGKWQTKQDIVDVADPDLPAASKAAIRNSVAATDQCIEAREARQPDANFFAGSDASECKYDRFLMAGGRIDAALTCTMTPGTMTMTISGQYTPTRYALHAISTTTGTGDTPITTSAKLTGLWLEPCADPAHPQVAAR